MSKQKNKSKQGAGAQLPAATTVAHAAQLLELGRLTQAEAACLALLGTTPDDPDALHVLGLVLAKKGEPAAAVEKLERALALRPSYPACRQSLGLLLMDSNPVRAEECFRGVINEVPNATLAHQGLATLAERRGDLKGAEQALRGVLRYAPLDQAALRALAQVQRHLGEHEAEVETGYVLLRLSPNDPKLRAAVSRAYFLLFDSVWRRELTTKRAKVVRILEEWLQVDPAHPTAKYMHAALTGNNVPTKASNEYLTGYFDQFAPDFDDNLTRLGYEAWERVKDALARAVPTPNADLCIVDMGCGTGRLGPLIAPWKKSLVGVDLSPRMVEQARARGVYDETHVADMLAFLRKHRARFDAATCLDTLVYFGELGEIFQATHDALRPGGRFFGTLEDLDPDNGGFRLHEGGRYSHSESYLREELSKNGFRVVEVERHALRKERGQDVRGLYFTALRTD